MFGVGVIMVSFPTPRKPDMRFVRINTLRWIGHLGMMVETANRASTLLEAHG